LGAPVKASVGRGRWTRPVTALVLAGFAAFVVAPLGVGFSTGIHDEMGGVPADFETLGCTSCHGGNTFGPAGKGIIAVAIAAADGTPLSGPYEHAAEYTLTITLDEQNAPEAANHAGFNLRVDAGQLAAVEGESQVNGAGTQATHVGPGRTEWRVVWTAPDEGPAVFDLWLNDVDGSGNPDPADQVYNIGFFLTDADHALPGGVEEEVHVGVPLPQYWIGLIALAGMLFIMVFGFFYLKFVNPHHTDQGDR
jgi:hypothetical protein